MSVKFHEDDEFVDTDGNVLAVIAISYDGVVLRDIEDQASCVAMTLGEFRAAVEDGELTPHDDGEEEEEEEDD